MIRKIHLYGSLAKAAGEDSFEYDVDTQPQLFAMLRRRSPALDMELRRAGQVVICTPDADRKTATCVGQGFNFGKREELHIATHTDGGYFAIPYLVTALIAVVVAVAVAYIGAALMSKNNPNGPGGPKSTMFNGPVNNSDQGGGIQIVYGRKVLVGSTVISVAEDYVNMVGVSTDPNAPSSRYTPGGTQYTAGMKPVGGW